MLQYDKIFASIGEFGVYQKRIGALFCWMSVPVGIHITTAVFNFVLPSFRCAVPGLANDTYHIQNNDHERLVNASIPYDREKEQFSQCEVYAKTSNNTQENNTQSCNSWVYASSDLTLAMDFDLVCDRAMYKAHINMLLLVGVLVGSLVGGTLSDLFGRKKLMFVSQILLALVTGGMAFAHSIPLVMVLRFFTSLLTTTLYLSLFVLLAEVVGANKRSLVLMASMFGYVFGCFILVLVQYLIRNWRTAQIVQSFPFVFFGLSWWFVQESPRWLLTKERPSEAQAVISYIAKMNGAELSTDILLRSYKMRSCGEVNGDDSDVEVASKPKELRVWDMCGRPSIAIRFTIVCFCWIVINMVYYGLLLGVGVLIEGDIYVNFSLQAFMEVLSYAICTFMLEKTGRKKIFCSSMILSGLSTLGIAVLIFTQADIRWLSVVLFCLGKLGISNGFTVIYIVTTELLPTVIRNSGLGLCSFVARFSGIATPYIVSASLLIPGPFGKACPLIIFGTMSLLSGLFSMWLPETRNKKLPETFGDNEGSENNEEPSWVNGDESNKRFAV